MTKVHVYILLALFWLPASAATVAAQEALASLAEAAIDRSSSPASFAGDVNAEVLRLLQHGPDHGDIAAIPKLVEAFAVTDADFQDDILIVLGHLLPASAEHRPAILETAVAGLSSSAAPVRVKALDVLGRGGDPAYVGQILEMLDDEDTEVRYQALYAISPFVELGSDPEIFEAIAVLVDDEDERIRASATFLMQHAPPG